MSFRTCFFIDSYASLAIPPLIGVENAFPPFRTDRSWRGSKGTNICAALRTLKRTLHGRPGRSPLTFKPSGSVRRCHSCGGAALRLIVGRIAF